MSDRTRIRLESGDLGDLGDFSSGPTKSVRGAICTLTHVSTITSGRIARQHLERPQPRLLWHGGMVRGSDTFGRREEQVPQVPQVPRIGVPQRPLMAGHAEAEVSCG